MRKVEADVATDITFTLPTRLDPVLSGNTSPGIRPATEVAISTVSLARVTGVTLTANMNYSTPHRGISTGTLRGSVMMRDPDIRSLVISLFGNPPSDEEEVGEEEGEKIKKENE